MSARTRIIHGAFLGTLPLAVLLVFGGAWVAGVLVFVLGAPALYAARTRSVIADIHAVERRAARQLGLADEDELLAYTVGLEGYPPPTDGFTAQRFADAYERGRQDGAR